MRRGRGAFPRTVRIVLASRAAAELLEARYVARHLDWVPASPALGPVPDVGATFDEVALNRARWAFARTGAWALGTASGLQVDALRGEPGVRSRGWSGEGTDAADRRAVLEALGGSPWRSARSVCVIALVGPHGVERVAWGDCEGFIGYAARGTGGDGYDAIFVPEDGDGRTLAEHAPAERRPFDPCAAAMAQLERLLEGVDETPWA